VRYLQNEDNTASYLLSSEQVMNLKRAKSLDDLDTHSCMKVEREEEIVRIFCTICRNAYGLSGKIDKGHV